jgi:hypothetical protein
VALGITKHSKNNTNYKDIQHSASLLALSGALTSATVEAMAKLFWTSIILQIKGLCFVPNF